MRLANEYEIINKIDKAEEKYINFTLTIIIPCHPYKTTLGSA